MSRDKEMALLLDRATIQNFLVDHQGQDNPTTDAALVSTAKCDKENGTLIYAILDKKAPDETVGAWRKASSLGRNVSQDAQNLGNGQVVDPAVEHTSESHGCPF